MRSAFARTAVPCLVACALTGLAAPAAALCKYKAADGSWTYSQSCARMNDQAIDRSAYSVIRKNEALQEPDPRLEGRRLRGYDYSTTTHSGMRIRMVEPNKSPQEPDLTSR